MYILKSGFVAFLFISFLNLNVNGQTYSDKEYKEVAAERAQKIVSGLTLDPKTSIKVKSLIAEQYSNLNRVDTDRDKKLSSNALRDGQREQLLNKADEKARALNVRFLENLSSLLTPDQVEYVKDGMTYHVVPKTYTNYLLMLPAITEEESATVLKHLKEAREKAMIAGSSKAKHAWFNKAKGKIANYLSARGYDLRTEGNSWAARRDRKSSSVEVKESERIMSSLKLEDPAKAELIRNLIAYQYQQLAEIHRIKSETFKEVEDSQISKEEKEKGHASVWENVMKQLAEQRSFFINQLEKHLSSDQVELVKNEFTGNGLKKEYSKFLALLPDLKEPEKKKVYDYLLEARANAMTVVTSRERNQWFAKYRGRANNYLSAQGYDLRKATERLEQLSEAK